VHGNLNRQLPESLLCTLKRQCLELGKLPLMLYRQNWQRSRFHALSFIICERPKGTQIEFKIELSPHWHGAPP